MMIFWLSQSGKRFKFEEGSKMMTMKKKMMKTYKLSDGVKSKIEFK